MVTKHATVLPGLDVAAGPQSRVQLAAVSLAGADYGTTAVTKAVLHLADGRRLVLDLPAPPGDPQPEKDWASTKAGSAILETLAREGRPLKGAAIAALANYSYNGSFRSALKGLEKAGEIEHDDDDGYTLVG